MGAYSIAVALKEALEVAFERAGYDEFPRSYVSDGSVAFDFDELLAIEWEATQPASGFSPLGGFVVPQDMSSGTLQLQAILSIYVLRNTVWPDETSTPPVPADIEASGARVHAEAALVLDTILAGIRRNDFGICRGWEFLGQQAVGPDGGIVGSLTRISVTL